MTQRDGNPDEAHQISDDQRRLLKAKTGFENYTAYLEDCNKTHPGYEPLLKAWGDSRRYRYRLRDTDCEILDVIKDEKSLISLNLCCHTASNSELFTALLEPRKGVYGRIVISRMLKNHFNDTDFLEDLGLLLKIAPSFVESLSMESSYVSSRFTHVPVFVANEVMVRDMLATMTSCDMGEKSSTVPIVFIADTTDAEIESGRFGAIADPMRKSYASKYGSLVTRIIERNSAFSEHAHALILPALLAVMHRDAQILRASCDYGLRKSQDPRNVEDHKHTDSLESMNTYRNELRHRIENFEDITQDLLTGLSWFYGRPEWPHDYGCESNVEYFTQIIKRARRIETHIRDLCQVQIGQLSLVESKKSIELSISQIKEGKRGEAHVHFIRRSSLTCPSQDM